MKNARDIRRDRGNEPDLLFLVVMVEGAWRALKKFWHKHLGVSLFVLAVAAAMCLLLTRGNMHD